MSWLTQKGLVEGSGCPGLRHCAPCPSGGPSLPSTLLGFSCLTCEMGTGKVLPVAAKMSRSAHQGFRCPWPSRTVPSCHFCCHAPACPIRTLVHHLHPRRSVFGLRTVSRAGFSLVVEPVRDVRGVPPLGLAPKKPILSVVPP